MLKEVRFFMTSHRILLKYMLISFLFIMVFDLLISPSTYPLDIRRIGLYFWISCFIIPMGYYINLKWRSFWK